MARKRHLVAILTIFCLFLPLISAPAFPENGTRQGTGPVHNIDKGTYYSTIQAGIDDADSGDTIEAAAGTYNENLVIDKTLTIIGENKSTTIIDGNSTGDVVLITTDWVNMTGFTIQNSGPDWIWSSDSGLKIHGAQNCSVSNNTLTQNEIGISISSSFTSSDSSITQIWDSVNDYPQINNLGQVTWRGYDSPSIDQIFFWDGAVTTQLTNFNYSVGSPRINNNGEITWHGSEDGEDYEIYLWDGNEVIQITNNTHDDEDPEINDLGHVVWASDLGILLWDGLNITQISSGDRPKINNNDQIVWKVGGEIFFWDGIDIIQLTIDDLYDQDPQINNEGHVVWESDTHWQGREIHYWDGNNIIQLTNNSYHDMFPQINDKNQVVWVAGGFEGNIMFWNGNTTTQITNTNWDQRPKLNNLGHLVWNGYFNKEVYYWNGEDISILTDNHNLGGDARINDNDEVVWSSICNEEYSVYLWGGGNITSDYANSNKIFNNTISYNEHGIRIETAYDNRIYHNYFVNNSNQTFCQQSNVWDDGYPSGGNYWSDYNGTDTRSGPNQDISGSDGIGDTVYAIFGGSYVDNYPLMAMGPSSVTLPPDVTPEGTEFPWFIFIFGSVIGVGVGLGLATEILKYSLLLLFLPLYMKIRKEEVLDLYLRGKIHGYIVANPGEHYNGIKKALNVNNGSLAYHLSVLEKEELVKSRNVGVYKCFYPYTMNLNGGKAPVTNAQKLILIQIEKNPGITQKLVASRLGLHPSTVNYHIKNLQKNNLVRTEKKGFGVKYYKK